VVVLTNCEEVRLTWLGKVIGTQKPETATYPNVPHPPVIFKNVFNFQGMGMGSRIPADQIEMVAEGLIGGQVAVREVRKYPQRAAAIRLELADAGIGLTADGSDFVPVRAYITDKKGVTKVLDTSYVTFEVTGPASIIGDASTNANPMKAEFGVATALIRAGGTPGEIHVKATSKGFTPAEIAFESKAPAMAAVGTVSAPPRVLRTAAPAPAPATVAAKAATPAETQKLNAEIKQLQQELTVKEQANQELQMKLNEKK
jgi:beta-galactosidase